MSCPNYRTMENFSLFVFEGDDADYWCVSEDIAQELEKLNGSLMFHKIELDSGHYYGLQFVVDEENDPNEMNNYECRCYFDMFRSVAIRRYNSEINKVNRLLRKLAESYGFEEMVCTAMFSNGEALYAPAANLRARLKAAVCCG